VGRPGENRTIIEFTRGHELDEIYDATGGAKNENRDVIDLARDGFQPATARAEASQKLAETTMRRNFNEHQRSILEDIVKSPESFEQALADAVISRALSLGGNFEKGMTQAQQEVDALRQTAE